MIKSELIIREPTKPLINRIIVAMLYAGFFTRAIYAIDLSHPRIVSIILLLLLLFMVLFLLTFMSVASHSIHLNFKHRKIQHQYRIGLFKYKEVWQDLIHLRYISVFNDDGYYKVNLWYKKRHILNLMALENYHESIKHGFLIAEKLNIDLLDARKRGHHKWVNKSVYKNTGKVEYLN